MNAVTQIFPLDCAAADAPASAVFRVPYVDLRAEYAQRRDRILAAIDAVCADARFILRREVDEFEARFAALIGVKHAIGVGNGTDALFLALKALNIGPGDEVVTVSHTFVATVAAIVHCGATPALVDVGDDFTMDPAALERAVTPRTKAIIPVHLNGRACDMQAIRAIAEPRGIAVIEDAAQAIGTRYDGRAAGALGTIGCFSLHPMKTLHGYGDGGMITTHDDQIADAVRVLRNHGQRSKSELAGFGFNSRLDNLQAAILLVNLSYLEHENARRRWIAQRYDERLRDIDALTLPPAPAHGVFHDIYNAYVVRTARRDALYDHLTARGIEVMRHWTPPLHKQPGLQLPHCVLPVTEQISREVLSLPIFPGMRDDQIDVVVDGVASFFTTDERTKRHALAPQSRSRA